MYDPKGTLFNSVVHQRQSNKLMLTSIVPYMQLMLGKRELVTQFFDL